MRPGTCHAPSHITSPPLNSVAAEPTDEQQTTHSRHGMTDSCVLHSLTLHIELIRLILGEQLTWL